MTTVRRLEKPVDTPWRLDVAAEMLGIGKRYLHRLIVEAGITRRRYTHDTYHPRRIRLLTDSEIKRISRVRNRKLVVVDRPNADKAARRARGVKRFLPKVSDGGTLTADLRTDRAEPPR